MLAPVVEAVSERVYFARELAREAGQVLRTWSGRLLTVSKKQAAVDLVTDADSASEALIVDRIAERFPGDGILAEEGSRTRSSSGFLWVIDPLDGTTNFVHRLPHYMVSLGLYLHDTPVGAALYAPALDEAFHAIGGQGAFEGERRIHVSETAALCEALIATGFPYARGPELDIQIQRVHRALRAARGVRRCGSAAYDLCNLARGCFDGYFEAYLKPWDTAAGALLVREAGGVVSHFDGAQFDDFSGFTDHSVTPSIVASNTALHAALLGEVVCP